MNELTLEDIEVLMDSLDALEDKAYNEGAMGAMLGMLFSGSKEEATKYASDQMQNADAEAKKIRDTIILLKAKLIQMKNSLVVKEETQFLRSGRK